MKKISESEKFKKYAKAAIYLVVTENIQFYWCNNAKECACLTDILDNEGVNYIVSAIFEKKLKNTTRK